MLDNLMEWLADVPAKLRVLLRAAPTWLAAAMVILGAVGDDIVPHLPGGLAVKVGGVAAAALGAVTAISAVVARLTPVLYPQNKGLLAPPPEQNPGPAFRNLRSPSGRVRVSGDGSGTALPPVESADYPPGSERLPHRRG